MLTNKTNTRSRAGLSRPGKIVFTLMASALCVEGAMAYKQIAYAINPCKIEDATRFVTADGGCKDVRTGRVWSRNALSPERGGSSWTFTGAKNLCSNLVEGGYDDWRLPTYTELKTVSANGAGTYLDVFYYITGDTKQLVQGDFPKWSSTTIKGGKYAYVVCLGSGAEQVNGWSTGGGSWTDVVCVR